DPAHPIYKIIKGQTASRGPTADPTRFLFSLAERMPPDFILFDRYAVSEWAARGAFTKLDEFVARESLNPAPDAIRPENFYKSCWDEVICENPITHERGIYGIPERVDDRAFFYNKDLLKRAGFVDASGEAQPPRTWEELELMAVKLTEHDARGRVTQLGFAPNFGNAWLYLYAWMNGGQFMSDDRRRCTLNSPPAVQAWELLKYMCSQHAREIIGENERLRLQSIGRIYVPTQNANRHLNQWAFQKYIASDPAIPPKLRDGVKLLNDLIDTSPFRPVTPVGQLLFNEQKRATENAIFHKMTAQEALNQSTQVVQSALDRVLSPPRGVIVPWKYFLAVYFLLITAAAIGIYLWETRTRFPHAPAP